MIDRVSMCRHEEGGRARSMDDTSIMSSSSSFPLLRQLPRRRETHFGVAATHTKRTPTFYLSSLHRIHFLASSFPRYFFLLCARNPVTPTPPLPRAPPAARARSLHCAVPSIGRRARYNRGSRRPVHLCVRCQSSSFTADDKSLTRLEKEVSERKERHQTEEEQEEEEEEEKVKTTQLATVSLPQTTKTPTPPPPPPQSPQHPSRSRSRSSST